MKLCVRRTSRPAFSALICAVLLLSLLPSPARADFTDVPPEHWAYPDVRRAEEAGAVNGTGGGRFDPDSPVTEAQFCAMLLRTFLPGELSDTASAPGEPWYAPYIETARRTGLSAGVNAETPDTPLTRLQMAQILSNLLTRYGGLSVGEEQTRAVVDRLPDGADIPEPYRNSVALAYNAGILTGMDETGVFGGYSRMTRAQAAAVWCRMDSLLFALNRQTISEPEEPAPPEVLTVGGIEYALGMSLSDLTAKAGDPDEILEAFGDYRWYVFGTGDYETRFLAAGVTEDRVAALCSSGKAFSCPHPLNEGETLAWGSTIGGLPHGSQAAVFETERKILYFDKNDGYALHTVFLAEEQHLTVCREAEDFSVSPEERAGESRLLFHLANAFRTAHGISPLIWDEIAEKTALLHAEDMAAEGYFGHDSPDGRKAGDRLRDQGMTSWSAYAENIANGYRGAVACQAGWIGSSGHRSNILRDTYTRFGAGIGVKDQKLYYVEIFYARMGE